MKVEETKSIEGSDVTVSAHGEDEQVARFRVEMTWRRLDRVFIRELKDEILAWQAEQFPNAHVTGTRVHLEREIAEAIEELVDVFFLATQLEHMSGAPLDLTEKAYYAIKSIGGHADNAILAKLAKNKARRWPTMPDAEGCYEAIDDKDADEK
jgi:hypothetical protein